MSTPPPELMKLMGKGGPAAPAEIGGAPGASGPVSAPMSTPQKNAGDTQQGMVTMSLVFDMLEKALQQFGSETMEGQEVSKALGTLTKAFGAKRQEAKELQPAELISLMQTLPQGGGMTPEMKAIAGLQGKMPPGTPPPGAAPGGAPGGMPPPQSQPQPMAA